MPGPVGRPAETVSPEVSECSRLPDSRRPAARATAPWAPSWAIVTTCRVARQSVGERTSTAAAAAATTRTVGDGWGTVAVTRAQNRPRTSTAPSQPHRPGRSLGRERVAGRDRRSFDGFTVEFAPRTLTGSARKPVAGAERG